MEDFPALALVGRGIASSLSPALHRRLASYHILDIASAPGVIDFLTMWCRDPRALGLNITAPYKSLVATWLGGGETPVNTVFRDPRRGTFAGCSTDGTGFVAACRRWLGEDARRQIRCVSFLGQGDTVLSLVPKLREVFPGVDRCFVFRRGDRYDRHVAAMNSAQGIATHTEVFTPNAFRSAHLTTQAATHLVIQATSLPHQEGLAPEWAAAVDAVAHACFDLCYAPAAGLLAGRPGRASCDGTAMLIEQARASQTCWFGHSLSWNEMVATLGRDPLAPQERTNLGEIG